MVFAESYGGSGCRSRESVAGRSGSGRERDAADEELNSSRHVASMSLTDNASVRGEENGNGVGDSVGGDANANDPGAAVRSLQSGLHGEDLLELQMLENRGTQRHKDGSSSLGWEEEELVVGPGSTHRAAPSRTSGLEKSSENEMFVSPLSTGSFPEDPPLDSRSSSDPNQHRLKESIGLGLESPALTEDHPDPSAQKSTVVNGSVEKASNAAGSDAQEPGNPSEEPQVINDEDPTQESTHQLHQSFSADSETNMDQNEDARVKISKISAVDPAGPEASSEKAPRTKERPRPSQTPSSPKVSPQKKPPCSPAGARRPFVSGLRQPSKSFLTGFAPQKVMTSLTPRLPPQRSSSADASRSSSRLQEPRGGTFSPSRLVRTPRHTLPKRPDAKPERSHGDEHKHHTHEADKGGSPAPSCFSKAPRPQLGLDPVKVRGQRSASPADLRKSRLRPPGFSHLIPARLAAFGFVRSGSVSSLSSNQSNDSSRSRVNSDSEDSLVSLLLRSAGCGPQPRPPPLSPARRSALPPPASPLASRKDLQRSREISSSPLSSPKRLTCPGGQRSGVEPLVRRLKVKCDEQEHQMSALREKLRKASLCLDVFIISTAHFSHKSETAALKETELLQLIVKIRDEAAAGVERLERLRVEKVRVEQMFDQELKELQQKQQQELTLTRQSLEEEKSTQTRRLHQQLDTHLQELTAQHHAQMEVLSEGHQASLMEMEATHQDTLKTLQEEHARTVTNLKMAHQQQKSSMQEEFEKLRLSLQDQVDTLTFQNRALRDRAKRFEEALRRSTDEQILDALAPYQHIEEDLKSLKEVVEMKNQQIHQQEQKISELEKMAQKNVLLEEQMKLLQQKNEDLKDRIDRNLAASRQLSEENANLQVHVEKESSEKKRLSRTNEELLWRLQTGEISPAHSPLHRPHSGPASPR